MLELAVLGGADPLTQKLPKPIRLLERWRLAIRFVEMRWIGRKLPIPLVAAMLSAKEEMLGQLRNARERTHAFCTKHRNET